MSDPPDEPRANVGAHRGMIPREELPFLPRIRWRFWAPILLLCAAFPVLWSAKRAREARVLRARLLGEYASLTTSLAPQYRSLRSYVETAAFEAVQAYPGDLRAPGFTLDALARESVLYGRVRVREVNAQTDVAASLRHRYPDQFASCLGVEPLLAREFLDKGSFLLPSFPDAVRTAESVERLHALREDLLFRLRRDTGSLVDAMRRRYLVVVVDEAAASIDGPSRVAVYDLTARTVVLRVRDAGTDVRMVPLEIAGITAHTAGRRITGTSVSGHDCSVANAARRMLGLEPLGMAHAPDAAPAAADAGLALPGSDAGAGGDAHP